MKRKILGLILIISMVSIGLIVPSVSAEGDITVELDGRELLFDVPPQIINDWTMLPIRGVFEAMGAIVMWDEGTQTATAFKADGTVVKVQPNSNILQYRTSSLKEGHYNEYEMATSVAIVNGRMLAPMRIVANSLGYRVNWVPETKTAYIETPAKNAQGYYYSGTNIPNFKTINLPMMLSETYVFPDGNTGYAYEHYSRAGVDEMVKQYCDVLINEGWTEDKKSLVDEDMYGLWYSKGSITLWMWVYHDWQGVGHRVSVAFNEGFNAATKIH